MARRKRPTMNDVAQHAGVALRTVSRVVNEDPTVGAEFVNRVRAAISVLGYTPDERARQLRGGRSGLIGAAVRNLSAGHPVLGSLDAAARAHGFTVHATATADEVDREREVVISMCGRHLDGIVLEPVGDNHQYLGPELDAGTPIVAFDRPAGGITVDTVVSDNAAGIGTAFRHLRAHGHRRIAYIGDQERIFTGHERAAAFRACMAATGDPVAGLTHPGAVEPARIAAALDAVLHGPDPATALITGNASTTFEVLRRLGPAAATLAIVGFDDFPLADLLRPALTVIAQDSETIGRTAIDLLRHRAADHARPVQTVTVGVELVVRGSGERSPTR
ncbi:LacI family DNA-binding transcriptional regulator [Dactylosporangium sucinum]|uniref:LacI family transcriptional regulator n=1 Tax=Dactylosporangium sucinum TaxID=1424081 RepID=A0A917WZ64_9ACTN|nr:LacI family DNA-binding transcriptional regulator [Dactylosporangium sucinum]GGM48490.1 LacI family transcriptional regulator [Dactylosporangium sucinum]